MASIAREKNGHRRILFVAPDGKRKTVRLGKVPQRAAEAIKVKIDNLVAAAVSGCGWDNETARWVADLPDTLAGKIAGVGLIDGRSAEATDTLGEYLADYIAKHAPTVKPATVTTWKQCERLLLEHFPADTPLRDISEGRAIEWRNYLKTRDHSRIKRARKLEETTIRKRCACARQFFEQARRLRLIDGNPFKSKRIPTSLPKTQQKAFVGPLVAGRILESLPSVQWRLLFALARWGGLRVPSEPTCLTWADVDWESMRLTVPSPKTEHHEGHEKRIIPIFPEIAGPLQDAWDAANPGDECVLPMLQGVSGAALRKPLLAAIRVAGNEPWPKLWKALRATRDTALRESYPVHVVESWLGHEDRVAKRNYTQVTDDHFNRAAKSGAESGALAAQNQAQQAHAQSRTTTQGRQLDPCGATSYATSCDKSPSRANSKGGDDRTRTCTPFGTRS